MHELLFILLYFTMNYNSIFFKKIQFDSQIFFNIIEPKLELN